MGLKKILDNLKPTFSEGGKLSAFGSLYRLKAFYLLCGDCPDSCYTFRNV